MHKLTSAPPLKRGDRHLCSRHPLLLLLPQGSTCFLKQGGGLNVFGLQRLHLAQCLRNPQHLMLPVESLQYLLSKTTKYHWSVILLKEKHYKMKQVFSFSQKKKTSQPTHHPKTDPPIQPSQQHHPQRSISPTCPWSALSSARAASTSERCRRTSASAAALASLNFAATWAFATCRWSLKSIHQKHVSFLCLCWLMTILM